MAATSVLQNQRNPFRSNDRRRSQEPRSGPRPTATRVRFWSRSPDLPFVLEVDAPASRDIVPEVHRVLSAVGVQAARIFAHATRHRLVQQIELADGDGGPLDASRRAEIQAAILGKLGDRLNAGPGLAHARPRS